MILLFGWILFRGSELTSEINVSVQFRDSLYFTLLKKRVLFCRFSGGYAKNLPKGDLLILSNIKKGESQVNISLNKSF